MELFIDNLRCRRSGRPVFAGLSAELPKGVAMLVRGPNGVGKSSLLRVLAGLTPVAGGDARLGTMSLARDRSAFQEHVAYAGHLDAVKLALTVAQNLAGWASIFGATPAHVAGALMHFGLDAIASRPVAQCSAGQRRRLGLARLMVMDRPLWLLDEPTVSLDAASSALVADLVRTHCAAGGSALIATHIDLGLEGAPVLEMAPSDGEEPARAGDERDAFLSGDWR